MIEKHILDGRHGFSSGMVACPSLEDPGLLVASWCRITERRIAYMYMEWMRSNQVPMYLHVVEKKGLEFLSRYINVTVVGGE